MANHTYDIHLDEPGDEIEVRDRMKGPGCTVAFSKCAIVYLSPEQETALLVLLMRRQAGRRAGVAGAVLGIATEEPQSVSADVLDFPGRGENFRVVGTFSGSDGDAA